MKTLPLLISVKWCIIYTNICSMGDGNMKVVAKPIEVISVMDTKGNITPLRLRIQREDETLQVIKVDKIITRTQEKFAGNAMIVFTCQSLVGDIEKRYELKYGLNTCRWILFKI
jgi:hypothetical protein